MDTKREEAAAAAEAILNGIFKQACSEVKEGIDAGEELPDELPHVPFAAANAEGVDSGVDTEGSSGGPPGRANRRRRTVSDNPPKDKLYFSDLMAALSVVREHVTVSGTAEGLKHAASGTGEIEFVNLVSDDEEEDASKEIEPAAAFPEPGCSGISTKGQMYGGRRRAISENEPNSRISTGDMQAIVSGIKLLQTNYTTPEKWTDLSGTAEVPEGSPEVAEEDQNAAAALETLTSAGSEMPTEGKSPLRSRRQRGHSEELESPIPRRPMLGKKRCHSEEPAGNASASDQKRTHLDKPGASAKRRRHLEEPEADRNTFAPKRRLTEESEDDECLPLLDDLNMTG